MSVSVVLLQYGLPNYTRVALDSIYESEPPVDEIIMVDNGSDEADKAWLRQERVRLIELPKNEGYLIGTNAGWKEAKGDFIVLCNNDISLSKQCIHRLENAMYKDEKIGWVTACYQCGGWSNSHADFPYEVAVEVHDSQGAIRTQMNAWSETLGDDPQLSYHRATEGTVFMVRKSVSDLIGYYWEDLKTGHHTHDYGYRIIDAGYKVAACANAVFWHSYKKPTIVKAYGRELTSEDQKDADKLMESRWGKGWRG